MSKSKPKQQKKPKQPYLPDGNGETLAPPSIPEIDEAAEDYRDTMLKRKKVLESEVEKKDVLRKIMLQHKQSNYRYEDSDGEQREVALDSEPGVTVRKVKEVKAKKSSGGEINPGDEDVGDLE